MTKRRTRRSSPVADAFTGVLEQIGPTADDVADVLQRYDTIRTCLYNRFIVSEVRLVGSFSKGTAVQGQSDVDIFACLARDEARWGDRTLDSRTFLRRVRDQLQNRYPTTEVRGDRQSVALRFTKGARRFDVVPAVFITIDQGGAIFGIPDGKGGWLETAPQLQKKRMLEAAERSGGKLPRVIQIVKWWTRLRSPALRPNSFHLEMVLTAAGVGVGAASYARLTAEAFRILARRQGRALRDPSGISHLIPAVETDAQKRALTTKLRQAANWAEHAVLAEDEGDEESALGSWDRVFNGHFT